MDGIPQGILSLNSRCSTNSTFQTREQGNDNTVPPCLGGGRTEWKLLSRVPFVPNTGYIKFHQYLSRPLKTLRGYAHTSVSPFFSSFPLFHTGCKNGRMKCLITVYYLLYYLLSAIYTLQRDPKLPFFFHAFVR